MRLILIPELMFKRFNAQRFEEDTAQRLIIPAASQHRSQIQLAVVAQAGPDFTVRGQSHFIAVLAEMQIRQRANEPDERARVA